MVGANGKNSTTALAHLRESAENGRLKNSANAAARTALLENASHSGRLCGGFHQPRLLYWLTRKRQIAARYPQDNLESKLRLSRAGFSRFAAAPGSLPACRAAPASSP